MTGQAEIERRVLESLRALGSQYEVVQIDPAFADTAEFCAKYGYAVERAANTIIVASKKEPKSYSACVVQATRRLDVNHRVAGLMGVKRLSFASADETVALTGMMIGGVTVFALPDGLPLYVDDHLLGLDWVIVGSGSRTSKLKVAPDVLGRVPGAQLVEGLTVQRAG